jgi:glucokinase
MIVTIDIGGTKTLVAGFNHKGEPVHERRFPTPKNPDTFLSELIELLDDLYKPIDIHAISVAIPGFVSNDIVKWCGNLPWKNVDLVTPLKKLFKAPVFVENDANLAGLAEASVLKPVPKLCLYVTVSTGIGSGVIADGKILTQLSGSEAGHIILEFDGKLRQWESFASGSAIHELYGKYGYEIESKKAWNDIADKISRGFVAIIPLLQPEVIVIGGSIGTHFPRYSGQLEECVDKALPPYLERPKISQAKHPQEAVLYGCYYQAVHRLDATH